MARKKIKEKDIVRKDDLDPDKDKFITKTTAVVDWAYERRRPIGLAIGVVLIVSVAGIAINHYLEQSEADDSAFLAEGLAASTALVTPAEAEKDPAAYQDAKARAADAVRKFKIAEKKTDGTVALLSGLGLANAYLELGEYAKAEAAYDQFLKSGDGAVKWLRPSALEGLCYALEASGKADEAISRFEELLKTETGPAAEMAKYQIARLAAKKNDRERASQLLREVIEDASQKGRVSRLNYLFVQARERLLELDPKAEVPDLPVGGLDQIDPEMLKQLLQAQGRGGPS